MFKKLKRALIIVAVIVGLMELVAYAKVRITYDTDFTGHDLLNVGNITLSGGGSLTVDTMTISSGSITDTTGAITFGNENLTTTGTMTANIFTDTVAQITGGAGTGFTSFVIDNITINGATITSDTGAISFGDENLSTTGDMTTDDIYLGQYLYHDGDTDTYLQFTVDRFREFVGNVDMLDIVEDDAQDKVTWNEGAADVDFEWEVSGVDPALFIEGSSGKVFINETINTDATGPSLTINQGTADDQIIAEKSSDVGHGITTQVETDTYGFDEKTEATSGGRNLIGVKDADGNAYGAAKLTGWLGEDADTGFTATDHGVVRIDAAIKSGTDVAAVNANGNILSLETNETSVWIADEDGDVWHAGDLAVDGGDITSAAGTIDFDDENLTTDGSVTVGGTSLITFTPGGGTIATTADGDLTLAPDGSGNIVLSSASLTSPATLTRHYRVGSSEMAGHPENPPTVDIYGITHVLEFTVDTDSAYYKLHIPEDYASGDILFTVHWTKSTTVGDDSTKTVKWQLKYLSINGTSENCNTGETTLSVQDTYDDANAAPQIVYETDNMTIIEANFVIGDILILEVMSITPAGTGLTAPAIVALCIEYTANQVIQ